MLKTRTIDSYHFGFTQNLTDAHLRALTDHFYPPQSTEVSALGGRTAVTRLPLDDIGTVVIKHYRRGGLPGYFTKCRYLRIGKTRCRQEFELLDYVGTLGVNVPEPIAYADSGLLFYRAWLVTREIHQPATLAGLSQQDEKKAVTAMGAVIEQVSLLIQNDILHVDLHPGNVVVDTGGSVYLLDFDKGRICPGNRQKLKNRYLNRWHRAILKHNLPKFLSEMMQTAL